MKRSALALAICAGIGLVAAGLPASASHSWSTYHWGRTSNPFTLKLGDNVTSAWDSYLSTASSDWTASSVLNTTIVTGQAGNVKRCNMTVGRVEVCNATYGANGWLGIAGISLTGGHIQAGYVKLNDTYFNTSTYNKPEWRRMVMCQEIGHTFGLGHTDENFNNANQGTCMDYTNFPLGPPSNEHPNQHDYDQLASIYAHTDSVNTWSAAVTVPSLPSEDVKVNVDALGNGTITYILPVPN